MKNTALLVALLATAACNSSDATKKVAPTPAPANSQQQAVAAFMKANAATFPGYEAVRWGKFAKYTRMSEAAIKGVVAMKNFDDALIPRNQALADYKASLARHDTPAQTEAIKARYGKANKYNDSLLVIANSFIGVKDTTQLGTEIAHTYRIIGKDGSVLDSATFLVRSNGLVEQI